MIIKTTSVERPPENLDNDENIYIFIDSPLVVAAQYKNFIRYARCRSSNEFNFGVGAEIAAMRVMLDYFKYAIPILNEEGGMAATVAEIFTVHSKLMTDELQERWGAHP